MQKIRVSKQFTFEAAHALKGYDGLCKHIHGHSYELIVTVIGNVIDDKESVKLGMVIDFGDLKRIVNETIVNKLDHALVIRKESLTDPMNINAEYFGKTIFVDYQPTSENMIVDFAQRLQAALPSHLKLHHLRLRETANSYAEWYAADNE